MRNYFEYRRIDELIDDGDFYRGQKEFTLIELSKYDGKNGKPAYVSIDGIVYDVSNESVFNEEKYMRIIAGEDLTEQFDLYCKVNEIINKAPKIGVLRCEDEINRHKCKKAKQNVAEHSTGDWVNYIEPLLKYVMSDISEQGTINKKCINKNKMLLEVFEGVEHTLQEAINLIKEWETQIIENKGIPASINFTTGDKASTSSGSGGFLGIAGGASGGAGGGFGVADVEKMGSQGGNEAASTQKQTETPPGTIGGASGGAFGGSGGTTTRQ